MSALPDDRVPDDPVPDGSVLDDMSDVLATGTLRVIGRITTASNVTLVAEAVDGDRSLRCVYKPIRGERPLWDFPDGTLAGREVAAYLVSEALGWGVVPETILRDGPLGPGMVQRWIDSMDNHTDAGDRLDLIDLVPAGAIPDGFLEVLQAYGPGGEEVSLIHADDPRLMRVAVLDVLINNADRKGGHALEGLDGQVYGVDHGISMHSEHKLRTVLWGWADEPVDDGLMADVLRLSRVASGELADQLAEHITDEEIEALQRRMARLLARPVMPRPRSHRPIPWPAF